MSKIIVTGGLGFIGSHFINYVNENTNDEIVLIDKMTYAANPNNIHKSVKFIQKDICDVTAEELGEYDYIVNFAAESHVDNSIKDGLPFVKSNVQGTFNMLEVARKNDKLKKLNSNVNENKDETITLERNNSLGLIQKDKTNNDLDIKNRVLIEKSIKAWRIRLRH